MIHSKMCKPRAFPWNSARAPEQIDRLQNLSGDLTLNREKTYEIGRVGRLGFKKRVPSFAYSATQFEYGSMDFFYALANKEDPASGGLDNSIDLDDLVETQTDIAAFLTDDNATFRGTIWLPGLRVNGFSINIADPDATIERSFDLIGEDYKMIDGKYLSYETATAAGATTVIVLDPVPILYTATDYIFRVLRVRSGVVSELEETTDWTFAAPATVTITGCSAGDICKVYYPSATAYTTTWTDNDSDPDLLLAEYAEIRLKVGTGKRIYRLKSIGIDVKFDRADYKEVGNSEVVQRGVNNKTVTIALNRFAEDFALEDILASDTIYPYIDPRNFAEDIQMQVLIYGEKAHTNFKIGYLVTGLSPTTIGATQDIEAYQQRTCNLESDNLKISDDISEVAFI